MTDYDIAHEEGIKQGIELEAKNIAAKLKVKGMDIDTISEVTGLSDKEIQAL